VARAAEARRGIPSRVHGRVERDRSGAAGYGGRLGASRARRARGWWWRWERGEATRRATEPEEEGGRRRGSRDVIN
jgi:hypothetical protein